MQAGGHRKDDLDSLAPSGSARRRRPFERQPWGLKFGAERAERRLLWFYHAGGSASSLLGVVACLPSEWEIWLVEYPGRGFCAQLPAPSNFAQLVAQLSRALPRVDDELPALILGHSMGGLVAYEYLRSLPAAAQASVIALVVSCTRAPSHCRPRYRYFDDAELLRHLVGMGQTASSLLRDAGFRQAALQIMRHDYQLVDSYVPQVRSPLETPLHVLMAQDDPVVSAEELRAWQLESARALELTEFAGGHFYYAEEPARFTAKLRAIASKPRP